MYRTRSLLCCALWLTTAGLASCNLPGADDDDSNSDGAGTGGAVGFVADEEHTGTVPAGGRSADAPQITSLTAAISAIRDGQPLTVSVAFEDPQGDVRALHFGVDGELTYYTINISSIVSGSVSGGLTLDLYPRRYVPGYHTLNVSLTDSAGYTSAVGQLPFTILQPDGTLPVEYDTEWPYDTSYPRDDDTDVDTTWDTSPVDTGDTDTGSSGTGPTFIMGYNGDSETGDPAALVTVTPVNGQPSIQTLTTIIPNYLDGYVHDYKAGRLAYVAAAQFREEGRGPIAVLDIASPSSVRWVPVPTTSVEGYHFTVPEARPQVLSDGRIVYQVTYQTDNAYDDFHEDQLALWNPDTDELKLQGGLSEWHRSQPEVVACNPDCDMEGGYVAGRFAVSPDGRYAYQHIIGMGVDMMMVHTGYSYFARWDMMGGGTERLEYLETGAEVWTVTGDNGYVVLSHGGQWKKYHIATGALEAFDDYPTTVRAGQTSQTGAKIMKGWRQCADAYGGVVIFDLAMGSSIRVIDPTFYEDPHKGINENVQMNANATEVYYTASQDACTNYHMEIVVMKSPIVENNPTPTTLMTLSPLYSYGFFLVLN